MRTDLKKQTEKTERKSVLSRGFSAKKSDSHRACFEKLLAPVQCERKPLLPKAGRA